MKSEHGKLFIISGPSGAGKSTVLKRLLEICDAPLRLSVSATTRTARPGEQEAKDYYFLTREEFERRRDAGEFLECKEVFGQGVWYGTPWSEVRSGWEDGKGVILEIDVQGAKAVIDAVPDAVTIFVHPGSEEELGRRLRERGTESDAEIERRLARAHQELQCLSWYQHEVVNDDVDLAARRICDIIKKSMT